MKKLYFILSALVSTIAFSQISLTTTVTPYTENFDGMGAAGTTYSTGFSSNRVGGSGTANEALILVATDGSAVSGGPYNVGANSSTDRALGSLASGSTVPAFGAEITNNTGSTITSLALSFLEEQWKSGSANTVNEVVTFSYSTDATSLFTGTWTDLNGLNLTEILTATTAAVAVDGNLPANQLSKSATISGLTMINGSSIWIKWTDTNDAGSDCLLAVDNLSITPNSTGLAVTDLVTIKSNFVKNTSVTNEINFGAKADVKIFSMNGQVVKSASVSENKNMEVSDLAPGMYIVTGTVNGEAVSTKIVKK